MGTREQELTSLLAEAVQQLDAARMTLAESQRSVRDAEQRVRLLEELLSLEAGTRAAAPGLQSQSQRVVDETVRLIDEAGEAMRIKDIRESLAQRGVPLPGKGADANLIAKFQRSPEIDRVGRGLYDIAYENSRPVLVGNEGERHEIPERMRMGADSTDDVVVRAKGIMAHHVEITNDGRRVVARATAERPLVVNGEETREQDLRQGDRLQLGEQEFRFSRF